MGHPCVSVITSRPKESSREQDSSRREILATTVNGTTNKPKSWKCYPFPVLRVLRASTNITRIPGLQRFCSAVSLVGWVLSPCRNESSRSSPG